MKIAEIKVRALFDPLNPRRILESEEHALDETLSDAGARVSDWELLAIGFPSAALAVGDGDSEYTMVHRFPDGSVLVWEWHGSMCHYDTLELACQLDPRLCDPDVSPAATWDTSVESVQERLVAQWDSDPSLQDAAFDAHGPTVAEKLVAALSQEDLKESMQRWHGGDFLTNEHLDAVGLTDIKVYQNVPYGRVDAKVYADGSVWVQWRSVEHPCQHAYYRSVAAAVQQCQWLRTRPRDACDGPHSREYDCPDCGAFGADDF